MASAPDGDEILSSLPYQLLLVFGGWFYILFAAVELFLLLFKDDATQLVTANCNGATTCQQRRNVVGGVTVVLFLDAGLSLPYPSGNMASEVCLLAFLTVVESVRISLGKRGNLTERSPCLALSVVLTVPSILGALYFLLWQTYVLRLDWVLAAGQVALQALQTLLAVTTMVATK